MSFELKPGKSLRKGIRRLAKKRLEDALEQMTGKQQENRDEAVHEARKSFKKLRALLRLVRPEIGEPTYQAENTSFRDAARPLTEVRDAKILIDVLDNLVEHFKDHVGGQSFPEVRKALKTNRRAVRKRVLDEEKASSKVAREVRKAMKRVNAWADVPDKWSGIGAGLEDVYRDALDAFTEASKDPTIEKLHEWRKQSKYLRYQLQVIHPLWPARLQELTDEVDYLGNVLGDDHDLAVLRRMVSSNREQFDNEGEVEMLVALIDRRRTELEQEAMLFGRRFFQEAPKDFAHRLKGYWKTWKKQQTEQVENAGLVET